MPTPQLVPSRIRNIKKIQNPETRRKYIKYLQLPDTLRKLLFDVDTADKIWQISQKHGLKRDQIRDTARTVGKIMLGELGISEFSKTLAEKCRLNENQTHNLAHDINEQIFLPVKKDLKELHKVSRWPGEAAVQQQTKPQTPAVPEAPSPSEEPPLQGNVVNLKQGSQ